MPIVLRIHLKTDWSFANLHDEAIERRTGYSAETKVELAALVYVVSSVNLMGYRIRAVGQIDLLPFTEGPRSA